MPTGKERPPQPPRRAPTTRILMCSPEHFDVAYAINPHMTDAEGRLRTVDRERARIQWEGVRKEYEAIGYPVEVLPGAAGFPDMTFAANQSFPFQRKDGSRAAILSTMRHPERAGEVAFFQRWFAQRGYETIALPAEVGPCEGMGDLLWHPGRRRIYGGYGPRTSFGALGRVAAEVDAELIPLRLIDPRFYHLDTALVPLDENRALAVREAFDAAGLAALERAFGEILYAPATEAAEKFACNAHCPDGRNVLIDSACIATKKLLSERGFRVRSTDTSEFRKSGGSVFCLKLELP